MTKEPKAVATNYGQKLMRQGYLKLLQTTEKLYGTNSLVVSIKKTWYFKAAQSSPGMAQSPPGRQHAKHILQKQAVSQILIRDGMAYLQKLERCARSAATGCLGRMGQRWLLAQFSIRSSLQME